MGAPASKAQATSLGAPASKHATCVPGKLWPTRLLLPHPAVLVCHGGRALGDKGQWLNPRPTCHCDGCKPGVHGHVTQTGETRTGVPWFKSTGVPVPWHAGMPWFNSIGLSSSGLDRLPRPHWGIWVVGDATNHRMGVGVCLR